MGKQIKANDSEIEEGQQHNKQVGKKTLTQFLPHSKYVSMRQKIYKRRLSNAIKNIQLDKIQIKKAVECLCKYAEDNSNPSDLAVKHEYLYLDVIVSKIPEKHSVRPIQVKLPFPIYSSQFKSRYTVITSDEVEDEFTERIGSINTPMLRQILSYQKVKKNFKQLKDKRQLLAANDLFFCDWKIYNLLRQPLGKLFYEQKKYPYPIQCNGQVPQNLREQYQNYESYINGLAEYTYTMLGNGPVYSIKIGKTKMTARQLVKNIMHGSYSLIANLLDSTVKPQNIRQICIKSFNSPSLPIYNYLTQEQRAAFKKI